MDGQWKDDIRRMMESHAGPLPDVSWPDVENALHAGGNDVHTSSAGGFIVWSRRIASVAAALLIVVGVAVFMKEDPPHRPASLKKPGMLSATNESRGLLSQMNGVADDVRFQDNRPLALPVNVELPDAQQNGESDGEAGKIINEPAVNADSMVIAGTVPAQAEDTVVYSIPGNVSAAEYHRFGRQKTAKAVSYHDRGGRLMAGLYMGNSVFSSDMADLGGKGVVRNDYYGGTGSNGIGDANGSPVGQPVTDVHHYQPVRIGMSVRYRLTERWSLESGMVYSMLSSDIATEGINYSSYSEQKLHYIGIPLSVSYDIWRNRHAGVYVSGGGMVEKMVSGKVKTRANVSGRPDTYFAEHVSMSSPQLSISGALGAEVSLFRRIGIFVEPGVNYYFDNNSSIPTFYKDKPFSFNLNLGVRYDIR